MIKKLLTDSAIYGFAPYIPQVLSVILLPILTQYLTDVDYGIAGTIAAYTASMAALSTLGFNIVLQISFFKSPCQYKILWREIYGFLQLWMCVFAVLQVILLYYIIPDAAAANKWYIIGLTNFNNVFFGPSALLGGLYYQLNQKPVPIAVRSICSGFISVLANFIFVVFFKWGYMGWYIGTFAGTFFVNFSYWYVLSYKLNLTPIYRFKFRTIVRSLKVALPTIPHYYSIFLLNTSNRMVMDRIGVNIGVIGEFNIAQQFASLMDSFVNAVNMAVNPFCMRFIKEDKEAAAKRVIYTFMLITMCATFVISLWSKELFGLLIRNGVLSKTYPYAIVLIMGLNYRPMYIAASNLFFYNEKTVKLLRISFLAGFFALALNIIFIPLYGLWAAVIINYISLFYMGYSGFFMRFFKDNSKVTYPVYRIMLFQILVSLVPFILVEFSVLIKATVSVIFIVVLFVVYFRIIYIRDEYFKIVNN